MLKKDLLKEVAELSGHPEKLVREILEATKSAALTALSSGKSVMLLGLGKLSVVHRGEKKARDLHSGAAVIVPPRNVAVLRPSDAVRDVINPGPALDSWLKTLPTA
jgi:nucleoid DNA-binding protein